MTTRLFCVIVLLCFSISCSTGSTGLPLIYSGPIDGVPITLEVKDAKLSDVLMWIADQAGLTSDMRILDDARVSMDVKRMKLSDVMYDLCYTYECEWRVSNGALVVTNRED